MPIVLLFSAIGRSHLGNPGSIRIFSSAEYCLRVLRRISRTVCSALALELIDFWLIFVPFGHDDEPEILRYAIISICPIGADVRHNWTRLSCPGFRNNEVRLQLHALAYNLGNFLRTLALPDGVGHWSLTTLREKLIKIGAKVVRHSRYITFQMAEVAVSRGLFRKILRLIDGLRPAPLPP